MSAGFGASGSGGQGFAIRLEADGDTKLGNSDGDLHQVTGTLQLNENVFFLANGRVGLGVSNPSLKLSVGGSMEVGEYIYHRGDTDTFIRFQDDSVNLQAGGADFITLTEAAQDEVVINESSADIDFRVESNGQTHMLFVDGANDRVGIQTDSPTALLHVSQSADSGGDTSLFRVDAYTQTNPAIDIKDNGTEAYVGINTSAATNALTVDAHSAGALAVRATNGHVGTTQDNYGLKIGTAAKTLVHDGTDFVFDDSLKVSGDLKLHTDAPELTVRRDDNDDDSTLQFQGSGGVVGAYVKFLGNESDGGGTNNDLALGTGATVTERIRIRGDGNVGIHTNAPPFPLTVQGTTSVTGTLMVVNPADTSDFYTFPSGDGAANSVLTAIGANALQFTSPNLLITQVMVVAVTEENTNIQTGTSQVTVRAPFAAMITAVRGSLSTASTSGAVEFDVNVGGGSIFSTRPTIDANETTTTTAATAAVFANNPTPVNDDDQITFDIDSAGTGARGLKVAIYYVRSS